VRGIFKLLNAYVLEYSTAPSRSAPRLEALVISHKVESSIQYSSTPAF
jgi:hypothetical protein